MRKIKLLTLSVLLLTVILGSAFSPRFATQYFRYWGVNEFGPYNYTSTIFSSVIPRPNNQLAWIEVDNTEIYPPGHFYQFLPMVDDITTNIYYALTVALSSPKSDVNLIFPVIARVELKP